MVFLQRCSSLKFFQALISQLLKLRIKRRRSFTYSFFQVFCIILFLPCNRLDENQQLSRFSYNNHVRDSIMQVTPERSVEIYEAYLTIGKMLREPANQIEHKMEPGDIITFNNARVLHGRSEYTITGKGSRFLSGIYLDWDIIYSRMRVLAKKLNIPFHC